VFWYLQGAHKAADTGSEVDKESRCAHYHSPLDIIAIKMAYCASYYACKDCHELLADRAVRV
jgi:uncharacterized CHY-type Zn-finger protein